MFVKAIIKMGFINIDELVKKRGRVKSKNSITGARGFFKRNVGHMRGQKNAGRSESDF